MIVSSPQDLVKMIVKKAYNMAEDDEDPGAGHCRELQLCECPDCGKEIKIFGESHIDEIAAELNVPVLGKMPVEAEFAEKADAGCFHEVMNVYLENAESHLPA